MADDDHHAFNGQCSKGIEDIEDHRRPHSRCSGFGVAERMRVPSPAASTMAESGRRFIALLSTSWRSSPALFDLQGAMAVDPCPTKPDVLASYVDRLFEDSVIDTLSAYVSIACLSPDFDPNWADNGEIARAAQLLAEWAKSRPLRAALSRSSNTKA